MRQLCIQPLAVEDLVGIWQYTRINGGERQADRYLDALHDTFQLLVEQPRLGKERAEFTPPVRIFPSQAHLVIYQAAENHLRIIRVLHKSMDVDDFDSSL